MLVCNVSLLARHGAIAAELAEAAAALDDPGSGNVVFATLVDDPASVLDFVDAYRGSIMVEAASAAATINAGLAYAAAIVEATTAQHSNDATITSASTGATWDPVTASNTTLSGGNLIATSAGGSTDHGVHVAAASGKTTGKYYFEITITTNVGGADTGMGIGTPTSTYTGMGNTGGVTGVEAYLSGSIYSMGSSAGVAVGGSLASGTVVGIAVDLTNRKMWFRSGAAGNWNNGAGNNPATNVGGVTIPAGTMVPFATFNATGNVFTANFGASGFTGAVPSGFTSGWI